MGDQNSEGLNALSFPGSKTRHLTWAMGMTTSAGVKLNPTAHQTFCGRRVRGEEQLTAVAVKFEDSAFCASCMSGLRRQVRELRAAFAPPIRPL